MFMIYLDDQKQEAIKLDSPVRPWDYVLSGIFALKLSSLLMDTEFLCEDDVKVIRALLKFMEQYKFRSELLSKWFFRLSSLEKGQPVFFLKERLEQIWEEAKRDKLIRVITE